MDDLTQCLHCGNATGSNVLRHEKRRCYFKKIQLWRKFDIANKKSRSYNQDFSLLSGRISIENPAFSIKQKKVENFLFFALFTQTHLFFRKKNRGLRYWKITSIRVSVRLSAGSGKSVIVDTFMRDAVTGKL